MAEGLTESPASGRRQGYGCLGLALFSLLGTTLFIVLGIQCLQRHELFDCIGLLTIFPAAFAVIGLVSAALGLQRFTSAGRRQGLADRLSGLETGWRPVAMPRGAKGPEIGRTEAVIHLPAPESPSEDIHPKTEEDEDA